MTRLKPPRQQTKLLVRERIDTLLSDTLNFPLSLLMAPAGSGKTTALAGFIKRSNTPTIWCRMTVDDTPESLIYHLTASCRVAGIFTDDSIYEKIHQEISAIKESLPLQISQGILDIVINELTTRLNQETLLVLDDYHRADKQPLIRELIERLIMVQPKLLHIVLSTRYLPTISVLPISQARGEIYQLEQTDIAFTYEETSKLFELYDYQTKFENQNITMICRGWPLILQMLVGNHQKEQMPQDENGSLLTEKSPEKVASTCIEKVKPLLDEYLLQQVFNEQPSEIQDFLLRTACLRYVDLAVCEKLAEIAPFIPHYDEVERRRLFLESVKPGCFQYQPLFHMFLHDLAQQQLQAWHTIHSQAAEYYQQQQNWEHVFHHLLKIGEDDQAATILQDIAGEWLRQGRAAILLNWIDRMPVAYQNHTLLLEARAAAYRQMGKFDQALATYGKAEVRYQEQQDLEGQARALRGCAEVYLDTVQPAPAETLLDKALELLPAHKYTERAAILFLQAENWANRGRADLALRLENEARQLAQQDQQVIISQDEDEEPGETCPITLHPESHSIVPVPSLPPRLLLRSGRLNESRQLLEAELGIHNEQQPPTNLAHREPLLLLAFLYALLGNGARAFAMAMRGLLESLQSGSQLTEAIAHMRVGHAHQVITPIGTEAAHRHYEQSLELIEAFGVTRTRVESYMGLALLHGHAGDLVEAERIAYEGLNIAEMSGDEWVAALIWIALGGAAVANNDSRGIDWLEEANQRFISGGDTYGQAVVALWQSLWNLRNGQEDMMKETTIRLINLIKDYGYEGLLTAPTLYGPRDMAMLIPILLKARKIKEYSIFSQQLLRQAFPTVASDETVEEYHPGYTLRIQMLGGFRVWRGSNEIHSREWQREKARQLLQLLLTYRGQWIQREQICAWLWPDSDLEAAERQFKVTLNALNTALEPFRPPRTSPFFVRRQGLAYSFAPSYGCWIDVDEFELRTTNVPQSDPDFILRNAQVAVDLYKGDYLAEALYDSWTLEERERLLARYLATATALANRLLEQNDMQHTIQICEQVLRRDRCYEEAYQTLLLAYARSGSRSQALRSYDRCVNALQDDLGIEPLPETTELYERIKHNEKV